MQNTTTVFCFSFAGTPKHPVFLNTRLLLEKQSTKTEKTKKNRFNLVSLLHLALSCSCSISFEEIAPLHPHLSPWYSTDPWTWSAPCGPALCTIQAGFRMEESRRKVESVSENKTQCLFQCLKVVCHLLFFFLLKKRKEGAELGGAQPTKEHPAHPSPCKLICKEGLLFFYFLFSWPLGLFFWHFINPEFLGVEGFVTSIFFIQDAVCHRPRRCGFLMVNISQDALCVFREKFGRPLLRLTASFLAIGASLSFFVAGRPLFFTFFFLGRISRGVEPVLRFGEQKKAWWVCVACIPSKLV